MVMWLPSSAFDSTVADSTHDACKVPAMRLAFLPPSGTVDDSSAGMDDKAPRLAIQAYPGAYTYPKMAEFLNSLADMLG